MELPFRAGTLLPDREWEVVLRETIFGCCKWDVQCEDRCVLARFPLLLEGSEWQRLARWAEALSAEALAAEQELLERDDLHEGLGLPRGIRKALRRKKGVGPCAGAARVMRFDFHFTTEGWRISEVNADVPGGFIEASGFTELVAAAYPDTTRPPDPTRAYAAAICRSVGVRGHVGFVHATAHYDDRQVMEYIARHLRALGPRTDMLSPSHLSWRNGLAAIHCDFSAGQPDLLVRFFPAEWLPHLRDPALWYSYFQGGRTLLSNPGTALLIQSKRFPIVWPELETDLAAWRALLPETRSPEGLTSPTPADWVFKPAFGRVGEDVALGGVTNLIEWKAIMKAVRRDPTAWVAQRRFEMRSLPTSEGPAFPCFGVFTIDGRAVGAFGRIGRQPLIGQDAQEAAVLLVQPGAAA